MRTKPGIIWGVSCLGHDASISVLKDQEILFAGHSERYSRIKNDKFLNQDIIDEALSYGKPETISYYESPISKRIRQLLTGDIRFFSKSPYAHIKSFIHSTSGIKFQNTSHHKSHAAAGYYTSNFNNAAIVVIDAIGEWDTFSIWHGQNGKMTKKYSTAYPNSPGLFYSAMTKRCGFKPNEEEYIMMGLAAYGDLRILKEEMFTTFIKKASTASSPGIFPKQNLHHGCNWWEPLQYAGNDNEHIAAAAQNIYEDFLYDALKFAYKLTKSKNLILMGGCALNCVANSRIIPKTSFRNVWIMPNPGDAGSSLGAALTCSKKHIKWKGPFLGTNIERTYNPEEVVRHLLAGEIIGIATGKAEFGPRALGNRSLLADPRGGDVQDKVNQYKKREAFRPFAPACLEEDVDLYFEMPGKIRKSPYMQFIANVKHPDKFPAITHIDGTARVQTVSKDDNPLFYSLLQAWKKHSGCSLLLNTSLNIKGEPLVNTLEDAKRFEQLNNIKVF